ncbi:MAG: tyrosine-type recombinase/integrase [Lachnospiraceae bacterium]
MSEKRRDSKNRILRAGESQRKDGRYAFKYTDASGKQQFVYAWKLVPTDKTPAGKRDDLSLREKIKDIQKDIDDGIDAVGKKMTVCQLYEKQNRYNGNIRLTTVRGRNQLMRVLQEDKLGMTSIENVKMSDAKEWILRLKEKGFSYSTIGCYKRSLKAAFYIAIQDDYIRKNPFDFDVSSILKNDTTQKEPLTAIQEESLLAFMKTDKVYHKYYDEVVVLLGTGLRISEFCGLTDADISFEDKFIRVDHQLLKIAKVGYKIEMPKTKSGIRHIPMTDKVMQALQRVMKQHRKSKIEEIDGYRDFVFINKNGYPRTAENYENMFRGLVKKYNKTAKVPLPEILTPHTLRHTFCTNMANAGMNPKALQYLMGHANINMTLNYYAHVTFDSAKSEMERLALK